MNSTASLKHAVRTWARGPYRLSTKILLTASIMVSLLGGLYSAIAYEQLARETMGSAQRWSDSVAQLVATNITSAVILNDLSAVESGLEQVAMLPGITRIAVFRPDGRRLIEVTKSGESVTSQLGGTDSFAPPDLASKHIPSQVLGSVYESWYVVDAGAAYALAWVRVHFSLQKRSDELDRLWHQSLLANVILVGLVLASLHFILRHALRPIQDLSRFAQSISQNIGSQFSGISTCVEADQLSVALNQASTEIAEQVARIQAIVNTAGEAIIGLDDECKVVTANPAVSSIFGRPEAALIGHSMELCVPGLNAAMLREMFGEGFGQYGPRRMVRQDLFGTRADGTPFPVEISLGEINGNIGLRYACIVRDVTDERAAQETSELYERALACSHNAVFISNARIPHHPIVYINSAFQKITNLPPHEVLGGGMEILRGVDPSDPGMRELTRAVIEQRNANVVLNKRLPDGSTQIAEVSLSPVLSDQGQLTHFVGILSDVTARFQAEEAIATRRAQLDAIFSLSPDGFVLFDANDRMVFANPAFERMSGLCWVGTGQPIDLASFETVMGEVCDDTSPFASLQTAAQDGEAWQATLHFIRPQTRVVQAQSRRNVAGRSETILYFRDVTHEDAVDRMKSEFLAAAAHELRTPMVSIFGFTELLLRRKYSEERQADMLQTIHRQSGLLVKMINELLDLARIESRGGLDMQIDAHPLSDLLVHSVKGLMRAEGERQVDVGDLPDIQVMIDPEKMQLAMNNLLSNAFKYSPQGGTVTLRAHLETEGVERFAVVEVSDQGIGMTPDQVQRAFERFYRVDASGNIPGTGLGLSLVKEVAGLHKGRVELSSTLGVGTTASLWIPLAKDSIRLQQAKAINAEDIESAVV